VAAFTVDVGTRVADQGQVRLVAMLQSPTGVTDELWYQLDEQHEPMLTDRADPFVLGALLHAMRAGADLHVRGAAASPSLLRNLVEFQDIWHAWYDLPVVDIVAEHEREDRRPAPAVMAFSGGVDSAFTAYRHATNPPRRARDLHTAVMIHGMDVPLVDSGGFERALARSQNMLSSIGFDVIPVATNSWEIIREQPSHFAGVGLSSVLHIVGAGFGAGLIASTCTYKRLVQPVTSTPVSDRLLGGASFEIVHDGAASSRLDKIRVLAAWPEACNDLRFCLEDPSHDRNCGRCRKCLLTYMAFHVLGVEPACFDRPPGPDAVLHFARWFSSHPVFVEDMAAIIDEATARDIEAPWVRAARRRLQMVRAHRAVRELSPRFADGAARLARRVLR
jgi:hypothetical protein